MERFEAYMRALAQVISHDWVHWCRNASIHKCSACGVIFHNFDAKSVSILD